MKKIYPSFYCFLLSFLLVGQLLLSTTSQAQYCASNATSTGDSKIDHVLLIGETVTINQNSAGPCETYTDNTGLPAADLMVGNTYSVAVTLGTCGGNYTKSASIFIDLNMDNDFDDPGENLGNTGSTSSTATLTANITIGGGCGGAAPSLGLTRMRIVGQEGGTPSQCGTYSWGETEDYTVEIIANPSPPAPAQFQLVGDAIQTSPQCMQLTAASNGQLGMAWDVFSNLDFSAAFSYDFIVNLGNNNGGADGLMFIIQNDPAGACVSPSGGWGAGNISNSLCVEIDTYLNTEDRDDGMPGVLCSGGLEPDHLDIWLNGNVNPSASCGSGPRIIPAAIPLLNGGSDYNIENGLDHTFRVTWSPGSPGTFSAILMDAAASTTYGVVTYDFDPMTVFGTTTPMYGISGSTGGLNNQQSFCIPAILLGGKISDFEATLNTNTEVNLAWTAVSQNNSDYFVIEKSADHMSFEEVATLGTQGSTNHPNYYSTIDPNPFFGISYYRLKQVNIDGSITYSAVKAIERKASDNNINIYPNPAQDQVTIELAEAGNVSIELQNQLGQQLSPITIFSGNKTSLDLSKLAPGVYLLQIGLNSSTKKSFKIIKK